MTTPFSTKLRLHPKIPTVDYIPPSYPILLRDGIMARIKTLPSFSGFKFKTSVGLQIQPENLPLCAVYFLQDNMTPDGDADAGEVRFRSVVRIGISVIVEENDPEKGEVRLDLAFQQIARALFRDKSIYDNDSFKVQAFTGGSRVHAFGNIGKTSEMPTAELRWELMCDMGTIVYDPIANDVLETIEVTNKIGGDGTPIVESIYEF